MRIGAAEYQHIPLADTIQLSDRLLQFLRIDVAPGDDDHVLAAPGDVNIPRADVPQIPGIEPVVDKQPGRRLGVAIIAAAGRRAAELHPPLAPLRQFVAGAVNNANFVLRQRLTAGDKAQGVLVLRRHRIGPPAAGEGLPRDHIDPTARAPAAERPNRPSSRPCRRPASALRDENRRGQSADRTVRCSAG